MALAKMIELNEADNSDSKRKPFFILPIACFRGPLHLYPASIVGSTDTGIMYRRDNHCAAGVEDVADLRTHLKGLRSHNRRRLGMPI
jgi:hypothetical protein